MNGFLQNFKRGNRRHFIQPLAVALVFVLFALLFFGMAMIDLGRFENLLVHDLRDKALYIAEVIDKASQVKYGHLVRDTKKYGELSANTADDQSFSLQEYLARELTDAARRADLDEEHAGFSESKAQELASSEHLQAIGFFDEQGVLTFQSAPLPPGILSQIKAMRKNNEQTAIRVFHRAKDQRLSDFVAIPRQNKKGTVVLVLNRLDLKYWERRISMQAAMEEMQWGTGVAYISVEDRTGQTIARFGKIPRKKIEVYQLMAGEAGEPEGLEGQTVVNTKFLELSFLLQWDRKPIGTVYVGLETAHTNRLLIENRKRIFLWTGLMVLIGLFAMGALYRTQNRHIAGIQAMQERLYQAERLSSLGQLAAGVAHEIRNPLNAISLAAQRLQSGGTKEKLERISHIIRDEIKRLNKIVEDFLSLSRNNRFEFKTKSITGLLDRILFLLLEEAGPKNIRIEKQWTNRSMRVLMDTGKMEQALLNIIRNAMESISGEGCITLSCDIQGKNRVSIKIKDTGSGIAAGEEKRIFDPFYTSKENGVGLGLAISHEIVLAHGGEIQVESQVGKGSTFEVLLPLQS
ncbi:MAG: ATP-binding protein [Syntrophobacteraceae bacterium]|nr:ATP-binding protein [Syntrophobacteraceae bacterium]